MGGIIKCEDVLNNLEILKFICRDMKCPKFTFHSGKIKTMQRLSPRSLRQHLHSTLVRLKQTTENLKTLKNRNLHSTLVRLKRLSAALREQVDYYLHSTLVRLKPKFKSN